MPGSHDFGDSGRLFYSVTKPLGLRIEDIQKEAEADIRSVLDKLAAASVKPQSETPRGQPTPEVQPSS